MNIAEQPIIQPEAVLKPTRQDIEGLQKVISILPQCETMITNHYFANGMYGRELHRKKGTLIVGKVHKHEHLFIVTKGHINVWTEDGMKEMIAPYVLVTKPGTKRVTYAMEDSSAMTIHRTDNTELDDIENEIIEHDPDSMYDSGNNIIQKALEEIKCLG